MEIIEVVTRIPLIQFIPNGNNKYENEQSTKVRVRSSIGIDENSLYYLWTTEKEGITEEKIKEETKATIRCIPFESFVPGDKEPGKCMVTGKPSACRVIFARSY